MPEKITFEEYSIVSCGTLRPELDYLRSEGFLNVAGVFYTLPGLHETSQELERQLKRQIENAKKRSQKILVVYGEKCYVDTKNPSRNIDAIVQEAGAGAKRINAKNCIDMLIGMDERKKISEGKRVYWLSPGWLKYWKIIFKDWDRGKANETFPQYDEAILIDSVGVFEEYSRNFPESLLEFSDWMKLNIESRRTSLDRLRKLLSDNIS